jgi:sugar phosphate permease
LVLLPFVPALARRFGLGGVVLLSAGLSTLLLLGVPLAPVLPVAGLFYVLRTGVLSMQWPAQSSFLQGAVDPRRRGLATSVSFTCEGVATALLPTLAGYFMDRRLFLWPLALGIGCYAAAAVWFYLTLRRTPLPEEPTQAAMADHAVKSKRLAMAPERPS